MAAIDPRFTADTEIRLLKLEIGMNNLWAMMQQAVSLRQFNSLNVIRQQEVENLEARIAALEVRMTASETNYNALL